MSFVVIGLCQSSAKITSSLFNVQSSVTLVSVPSSSLSPNKNFEVSHRVFFRDCGDVLLRLDYGSAGEVAAAKDAPLPERWGTKKRAKPRGGATPLVAVAPTNTRGFAVVEHKNNRRPSQLSFTTSREGEGESGW